MGYVGAVTEENITEDTAALGWGEVGKTGIERAYDAVLRGNPGVKIVETNSQGAVLSEGIYRREDRGENSIGISSNVLGSRKRLPDRFHRHRDGREEPHLPHVLAFVLADALRTETA